MARFHQGIFKPKFPDKYKGTHPIVYRSGWEARVMSFLDSNPSVTKWGSESVVIPYISPLDNRPHRYFTDFVVSIRDRKGVEKTYILEIKPDKETKPPVPPKSKNQKRYLAEVETYVVNQAKWKAAKEFCANNGIEFLVLTEYDIGLKKR